MTHGRHRRPGGNARLLGLASLALAALSGLAFAVSAAALPGAGRRARGKH
jgi:hypothetical protein